MITKRYYVFLGLFLAALAFFVAGLVTGNVVIMFIAFGGILALYITRRHFIPPRRK